MNYALPDNPQNTDQENNFRIRVLKSSTISVFFHSNERKKGYKKTTQNRHRFSKYIKSKKKSKNNIFKVKNLSEKNLQKTKIYESFPLITAHIPILSNKC